MEAAKQIKMYPIVSEISKVEEPIPGGFYIKARKIEQSEIAHAAPVIREVWDWILRQCNHKDNASLNLKRGQCMRSIRDVQEGLHWHVGYRKMEYTKTQCENALEYLRNKQMITTTKTTRGLIITVCKYATYQDIKNYEYNSEDNKKTTRRQQQGATINKNDKESKNDNSLLGADAPAPTNFKSWTKDQFRESISKNKECLYATGQAQQNICLEFFKYWTEPDPKGRMRFQLEKTWDTERRLQNWENRDLNKK